MKFMDFEEYKTSTEVRIKAAYELGGPE